jgi:hypothetical protein
MLAGHRYGIVTAGLPSHREHLRQGAAASLLVDRVKRVGHGFRNLINDRLCVLLHGGIEWQTHRTVRLRGRHPRLVA